MIVKLESKIGQLKKTSKGLTSKFKKLRIETIYDLIFYFPFRYEDYSLVAQIKDLSPGMTVTVKAKIELIANKRTFRNRKLITESLLSDDTGSIKVIWFNQPWLANNFSIGDKVIVSGKIMGDEFNYYFNSPNIERQFDNTSAKILPVYPTTNGLNQKQLRNYINLALDYVDKLIDPMPEKIVTQQKLLFLNVALREIHFPSNKKNLASAKKRLAFDEIFFIQLWSKLAKRSLMEQKAQSIKFNEKEIQKIVQSLPFKLTFDQKRSTWEIIKDMEKITPMNRLLEGDVGSGKTLVAIIAAYNTALNGFQTALMAPTEILALQHFETIKKILPQQINFGLLTRKQKIINHEKKSEKEFFNDLVLGKVDIVVGTHALIQKNCQFNKLALVIIDEQHRFGVEQRKTLRQKSNLMPHFLSMTATPIPRSLALTIYGDLELSIIKQLPEGRKRIITKVVEPNKRQLAYEFILEQINQGRQVFIICPLIDPSDVLGVRSVTAEHKKLDNEIFPDVKVGLLHGKLKSEEKEQVISDFAENKIKILVATSVIEVGINIPNATVMMIEGAERFGLAQLHQFRGRVGRSEHQSFCLLFSDNEDAKILERLTILSDCFDGFELAQLDLKLRGFGNVYGQEQSGFINKLKIADLNDLELIKNVQAVADDFINSENIEKYPLLLSKINNLGMESALE